MQQFNMHLRQLAVLVALLMFVPFTVRANSRSDGGPTGYLSVGVGVHAAQSMMREDSSGLKLYINGRYEWRRIFFEYSSIPAGEVSLPTLGYNFYRSENWFVDAVYALTNGETEFRGMFNGVPEDFSREHSSSFGVRATGVYDQTLFQVSLLPFNNEEYDRGTFASAWLAQDWQFGNWTLRGALGAQYRSEEIMDYYFGVDADEAGTFFSEYHAEAGTRFTGLLQADYPLTENIVFQTYLSHTEFSDSAKESPLMRFLVDYLDRPDNETQVGLLINYVF